MEEIPVKTAYTLSQKTVPLCNCPYL